MIARVRRCILARECAKWMKGHPLLGWYIAIVVTLDFFIHLAESHVI